MYNLLNDLSIVEVSSFVASPTAGLYCAQLGAEVIRVDHKAGGLDYDRYMLTREGRSLSWENLNRAKKSVALDLHSEEGRELAAELDQGPTTGHPAARYSGVLVGLMKRVAVLIANGIRATFIAPWTMTVNTVPTSA